MKKKNIYTKKQLEKITVFLSVFLFFSIVFYFPMNCEAKEIIKKASKKIYTLQDLNKISDAQEKIQVFLQTNAGSEFSILNYGQQKMFDFLFNALLISTQESVKNYEQQKVLQKTMLLAHELELEKLMKQKEIVSIICKTVPFLILGTPFAQKIINKNVVNLRGGAFPFTQFAAKRAFDIGKWVFQKVSKERENQKHKKEDEQKFEDIWSNIQGLDTSYSNKKRFYSELPLFLRLNPLFFFVFMSFLATFGIQRFKKDNVFGQSLNKIFPTSKEEKSFFKTFKKFVKKHFSWLITTPQGILFLMFLIYNRKVIFHLLTNSSEREHLVEALKQNIGTIKQMADERVHDMRHWATEFYKQTSTYSLRDFNNLVTKDNEIRKLQEELSSQKDFNFLIQSANQANIHNLSSCNNELSNLHQSARALQDQNLNYYRDIISAKEDIQKFVSLPENKQALTTSNTFNQGIGIKTLLEKTYHVLQPGSTIQNLEPPKFDAVQTPIKLDKIEESTQPTKKWFWDQK